MYQAVLVSEDGEDFVTDFERETVQEVWDCVNDMGSRWIFYPYVFVTELPIGAYVRGEDIIVDTPELLEHLKGETINYVMDEIELGNVPLAI